MKDLSERDGRRTLKGGGQRWGFRRVAEGEDWKEWQEAERNQKPDKERWKQRHPRGSICRLAVGDEQRKDGDGDGRDRYPEPGSLVAKNVHAGMPLGEV